MKWIVLFAAFSLFSTERLKLVRDDGSELIAYFDEPEKSPYSMILLIEGSQRETSLKLHSLLKEDLLNKGFCPITLEKRGVILDEIDETQFNTFLPFNERLADYLYLHKNLKTLFKNWDGKIAILGQGDGGRIGAHLATKINNVCALALIASGGAFSPIDEALYSFRSIMAEEGYSPQYIHGFLVQAKQEFLQAIATPKVEKEAFGYSYKYWESLSRTNLPRDLSELKCPIYSINGEKDDRVPMNSVDQLAKFLENRITLIRKENQGREILQDPQVYREAVSWLSENFR